MPALLRGAPARLCGRTSLERDAACRDRYDRFLLSPKPAEEVRRAVAECIHVRVDDGRDVQRDELRKRETSDHRDPQPDRLDRAPSDHDDGHLDEADRLSHPDRTGLVAGHARHEEPH